MSDSNPRSKKILHRIRARTEPAWRVLVGWGAFFHNLEKVVKPLWRALHSHYVYPWVLLAMGAVGIQNTALAPEKPTPDVVQKQEAVPRAAELKQEPPKSLAPLEKPKPDCIGPALAKMRDALSDHDAAEAVFKRLYAGRFHCGWYLTVAAEPVPTGVVWRVRFQSRDGIRVVAEVRSALPLYEGDIVQVGGMVAEYRVGTYLDKTPTLIVQRAWIQKR